MQLLNDLQNQKVASERASDYYQNAFKTVGDKFSCCSTLPAKISVVILTLIAVIAEGTIGEVFICYVTI